jgi:hypothetical protein
MNKKIAVEEGSDNVFADIGLPDPEERLAKADLAICISEVIRARRSPHRPSTFKLCCPNSMRLILCSTASSSNGAAINQSPKTLARVQRRQLISQASMGRDRWRKGRKHDLKCIQPFLLHLRPGTPIVLNVQLMLN